MTSPSTAPDRRAVLSRRAVLAGMAALPVSACTGGRPDAAPLRRSAVVVGAGLSGLTAAYDLGRAGWQVTVLEAATEVGGRIRTVRQPALPEGLHGEAGGDLVHPAHDSLLTLVRQLRLEAATSDRQAEIDDAVCLGGVPERAPDVITDDVRAALAAAREVLVLHADPSVADVSCAQALHALDLSPLEVHLLDASIRRRHGQDLTRLSAAFVGAVLLREPADATPQRITGGADRLIEALVDAAEADIRTDHAVTSITQDSRGVTVTHSRGQERADRVVLAVPAGVAATMDLGGEQELSIRLGEVGHSTEVRVLMVYDRRSWLEERLSGTVSADGTISAVRDATPIGYDGGAGLLIVDGVGRTAGNLLDLSQRPGQVKAAVDACLPDGPLVPGRPAVTVDWKAEPWALGGRPGFAPGAWQRAAGLREPYGRIHLAGDHTGEASPGTMDAAVEAGRRAARQVIG